jgi:hypothetical protein
MNEWIPLSKRPPAAKQVVIAGWWNDSHGWLVDIAIRDTSDQMTLNLFSRGRTNVATHWMPMPKPPKKTRWKSTRKQGVS